MSNTTIQKFKDLDPINDEAVTHAMMQMLLDTPRARLADFHGQSGVAGQFYLFKSDAFPGKVLEYVPGIPGDDSVSTLYTDNRVFGSRQFLIEAREELIRAIEHVLMAVPGTTVVRDNGRERECHLHELGTAQLLDTLVHFNLASPIILGA